MKLNRPDSWKCLQSVKSANNDAPKWAGQVWEVRRWVEQFERLLHSWTFRNVAGIFFFSDEDTTLMLGVWLVIGGGTGSM